jgi:hypothetical protein
MAFQGRRFQREYFPFQDEDEPLTLPSDANEPAEFVFARLRYGNVRYGNSYWMRRGAWSVDFPKADRQFLQGVRRLTRINARSVEHVVDLVSDDIFNYPFVYVVEAGHWDLPDDQARKLREYIDRGGFLMTDDFHGTMEWGIFMQGIEKAFPGVTVTDLENDDPIFHVLYDLDQRFQVPGIVNWPFSQTHEYDGFESRWRALRDAKGRVVMAICHNMDLGDAWEWADHPKYPEKYASLAYRVGINNIIYAMTH